MDDMYARQIVQELRDIKHTTLNQGIPMSK